MKKKLLLIIPLLFSLASCNDKPTSSSEISSSTSSSEISISEISDDLSISSSEMEEPFDLNTLKANVSNINSYQANVVINEDATYSSGSKKSSEIEIDTKILVDGNAYEVEESNKEKIVYNMTLFAEEMSMSKETLALLALFSPGVTIDKENDLYITEVEETKKPVLYNYDEDNKQYINYLFHEDKCVDAKYDVYTRSSLSKYLKSLISEVVIKGTIDNSKNEINFTFDDDFKQSEIYEALISNGCYASSLILEVKNNNPDKIIFSIDKNLGYTDNKTINEMSYEINISNINQIQIDLPEGEIQCSTHSIEQHQDDNECYYYCKNCGLFITEPSAHEFDETYGVCEKCGYVKGGSSDFSNTKYSHQIVDGVYVYSYLENEKGYIYNVNVFNIRNDEDYNISSYYDDEYTGMYSTDLKVLVLQYVEELGYLSEDSCVKVFKIEYDLYTDVEIVKIDEDNVTFNDMTISEFVLSGKEKETLTSYDFSLFHDFEEEESDIDECHHKTTGTCNHCHQDLISDLEYKHQFINFKEISYQEMISMFGTNYVSIDGGLNPISEDYHYYEATCSLCDEKLYLVSTYSEGLEEDHNENEYGFEVYGKEGLRTIHYDLYDIINHYDDGTSHCLFCHQEM